MASGEGPAQKTCRTAHRTLLCQHINRHLHAHKPMPLAHRPVLFAAKSLKTNDVDAYVSGFVGFLCLNKQTNRVPHQTLSGKFRANWLTARMRISWGEALESLARRESCTVSLRILDCIWFLQRKFAAIRGNVLCASVPFCGNGLCAGRRTGAHEDKFALANTPHGNGFCAHSRRCIEGRGFCAGRSGDLGGNVLCARVFEDGRGRRKQILIGER